MRKFLCWLGFHDWIWNASIFVPNKGMYHLAECSGCKKNNTVRKSRMVLK